MKVNIGVFAHNAKDWERVQSGDYSRLPAVQKMASLLHASCLPAAA